MPAVCVGVAVEVERVVWKMLAEKQEQGARSDDNLVEGSQSQCHMSLGLAQG
jgi:hypothetical protein